MADQQDTIAAVATPPGQGGIGIVRLSGPLSLSIGKTVAGISPSPRKASYCAFRDRGGEIIDRGLLIYFKGPESFTGEDVVELHGHGGPVVMNRLLRQVLLEGARPARPGEFSERAFLNNKMDLVQAEAVADLISSATEQAARSAIRSIEGDLSGQINQIKEAIIDIRVYTEGALDFPEEEIDFISGSDIKDRALECLKGIEALIQRAGKGRLLNEGIKVVIAGPPNAGKSSILNRLTQTDRAIVTKVPGTTRDVVEDRITIEGVNINLADTAGLRASTDPIESEGIERSLSQIAQADVVLLVTECGKPVTDNPLLEGLDHKNIVRLENKIDLVDREATSGKVGNEYTVSMSAKTGEGLDLLRASLREAAGMANTGETVLLARTRHIDALNAAAKCLVRGLENLEGRRAPELFAEDLAGAQQALARITGEFTPDDLLGEIFSRFCIGK